MVMLVVCEDDIMIIGDNTKGIDSLKKYLQKNFQTKNLESPKYFLDIEVARFVRQKNRACKIFHWLKKNVTTDQNLQL